MNKYAETCIKRLFLPHNAGILAAQILALGDASLALRLEKYRAELAEKVKQSKLA